MRNDLRFSLQWNRFTYTILTNRGHDWHDVFHNVRSCKVHEERNLYTDATPPDPVGHNI